MQELETEMTQANLEYIRAVNRASRPPFFVEILPKINIFSEDLHSQISEILRMMLEDTDAEVLEAPAS